MSIKATNIQITGLSYDFSQALVDIDFSRADGDKSSCTVWLPFQPFRRIKANHASAWSEEVVWLRREPKQLQLPGAA